MRKFLVSKAKNGENLDGNKSEDQNSVQCETKPQPMEVEPQKPSISESSKIALKIALSETSPSSKSLAFNQELFREASALSKDVLKLVCWDVNESVPYNLLVATFEDISKVSGRIEKENFLSRLFSAVILTSPHELETMVYLASNHVYPAYEGLELGIGDSLLVKAICEATGRKKDSVDEAYEKEGDLGIVAVQSRTSQTTLGFVAKPKPLLASHVLEQFRSITQIKGEKSQARKVEIIKSLMVRCQGQEAKYIVRALQGKLRIGTAEQTVLVALAHALVECQKMELSQLSSANLDEVERLNERENEGKLSDLKNLDCSSLENQLTSKSLEDLYLSLQDRETIEARYLRRHWLGKSNLSKEKLSEYAEIAVKRAFSECPNLGVLVSAVLHHPLHNLFEVCKLKNGIPVAPMLAKPSKEISEVLRRLSGMAFTMEYKYDGERAQVHFLPDSSVKIFSRNSEDNTEKYPDLKEHILRSKSEFVESCIIDAEVVAYDREKGCLLPFQVLSTRKRKVESGEEDSQKVKVILQVFDMLYLNGKSLLRESLRVRRELLRKSFHHTEQYFHMASGMDHVENGDTAPIESYLNEACNAMCEGLMVKTLDDNATYEPSKRSLNWLKLKKDYINGMGVCDSVDLVPIGGYRGKGKRVNVYGAYLMACYDPDRDEYLSVCKLGTGFSDEDLARLTNNLKEVAISSKRKPLNYNVGEPLFPDDWFEAGGIVWEVQAADLSRSSVHRGGLGRIANDLNDGTIRGIGLRFPRFLREREDKRADQATSSEQIVDMFYNQNASNATNPIKKEVAADDEEEEWI